MKMKLIKFTKTEMKSWDNEQLLSMYLQVNKYLTTVNQTKTALKYDEWLEEEILSRMK